MSEGRYRHLTFEERELLAVLDGFGPIVDRAPIGDRALRLAALAPTASGLAARQ